MVHKSYCIVPSCGSRSSSKDGLLRFHPIPKSSFFEWVNILQLEGVKSSNEIVHVCSKHFKPEDYTFRGGQLMVLKAGVVPTVAIPKGTNLSLTSDGDHSLSYMAPAKSSAELDTETRIGEKLIIEEDAAAVASERNSSETELPEETTIIHSTENEALTVKEISNKRYPTQKKVFVTCGNTEYVMTAKSMRTMCRICFSDGNLSCMFTTTYKDVSMSDIVARLTGRAVPQGRLAQNLCLKCIKSLGQLYKFSERCKISENLVRLCHKIFFTPKSVAKLDKSAPLIVTPTTTYRQSEIKRSYLNKRKLELSIAAAAETQTTAKAAAAPTPAVSEKITNLRKCYSNKRKCESSCTNLETLGTESIPESLDILSPVIRGEDVVNIVDMKSLTEQEQMYMKRLEEWKKMNTEKGIDPLSKKPRYGGFFKDKDVSNNSHLSKPITVMKVLEKPVLVKVQNLKQIVTKLPAEKLRPSSAHSKPPSTDTSIITSPIIPSRSNILKKVSYDFIKRQIKPLNTLVKNTTMCQTAKKDSPCSNDTKRNTVLSNNDDCVPEIDLTEELPEIYKCLQQDCGKVFPSAVDRARHNLHLHATCHCDLCDSDYIGQRRLKIHFYKVHSLCTSYKCNLCELVFGKSSTYLAHKKDCKTYLLRVI